MGKHLLISQTSPEGNVPASIVQKLYNMCKRKSIGQDLFDSTSNLVGIFNTGYTYEDWVNLIHTYFPQLVINSAGYYILFEDEFTKNILFTAIDWTAEGITAQQAADINLSNKIKGTPIIRFNEFKYFTSNGELYELFKDCVSLTEITMPPIATSWSRTYWDHAPFYNCKSLVKVNWNNCIITGGERGYKYNGLYAKCESLKWYDGILPPGCDEISADMFDNSGIDKIIAPEGVEMINSLYNCPKCTYIELPSTLTEISAKHWGRNMNLRHGGTGQIVMVCKATIPPTLTYVDGFHDADTIIYVPDDSVSAYQTTWSAFPRLASINGLSELPETYKNMGTLADT